MYNKRKKDNYYCTFSFKNIERVVSLDTCMQSKSLQHCSTKGGKQVHVQVN